MSWVRLTGVSRVARVWRRRPTLTLAVVGTISLALGLSVAMSAILHTVARRALVFPNGADLVHLYDEAPEEGSSGTAVNVLAYAEWRASSPLYRQLAGYNSGDATVWVSGRVRVLPVTSGSGNLLATLGASPDVGRLPTVSDEGVVPCAAVAARSTAVSTFGSAEAALDRLVTIDDKPCRVIGVVADRYGFPNDRTGLFVTLAPRAEVLRSPDGRVGVSIAQVQVIGLPRHTATPTQLQAEAQAYFRNRPRVRSLHDSLTVTYRETLRTLGLASVLVLAVALLNLSAVLAMTAVQRVREWAIKGVLGASRAHLLRDVLTDAVVLVVPGGLCGLMLASTILERVRTLGPSELRDVALEPGVLGIWLVTLVPVIVLNGVPAWLQASHLAVTRAAQLNAAGVASTASAPARRFLRGVVTVQLSGAVVLVAVCLLFVATITAVLARGRGFSADDVVVVPTFRGVNVSIDTYLRDVQQLRGTLSERDGQLTSIALDLPVPHVTRSFSLRGEQEGRGSVTYSPAGPVRIVPVGPDYLRTMRTSLIAGRDVSASDGAHAPPVAVVSRRFASVRFGDAERALGQVIDIGYVRGQRATIVGIAEDVRRSAWQDADLPVVYISLAQRDLSAPTASRGLERLLLISRGRDRASLSAALADAPPTIGVGEPWTLRQARLQEAASLVLYLALAAVFGATTLLVIGLGVYAVSSEHVDRRRPEFGVRQVAGATPARSVRPACLAFGRWWAIAVPVGVAAGSVVIVQLGVWQIDASAASPLILASSVALVTTVAALGVALPLTRVLRRQPAQLLRGE